MLAAWGLYHDLGPDARLSIKPSSKAVTGLQMWEATGSMAYEVVLFVV